MKIATILAVMFLLTINVKAQDIIMKLPLEKGRVDSLKCGDFSFSTVLLEDEDSWHLSVEKTNNKTIATFHIDKNGSKRQSQLEAHGNYFLYFLVQENSKYLIIEKSQFGKVFFLPRSGTVMINDLVEIELVSYVYEWGYTSPEERPEDYFQEVSFSLRVKAKGVEKEFDFYSYEIEGNFLIELDNYTIQILSDIAESLEMIVNEKK